MATVGDYFRPDYLAFRWQKKSFRLGECLKRFEPWQTRKNTSNMDLCLSSAGRPLGRLFVGLMQCSQ